MRPFTGKSVTVAHIGDSRCYLLQEDDFIQLTEDHSLVNELVKTGEISKEDAEHHPRKMYSQKLLEQTGRSALTPDHLN